MTKVHIHTNYPNDVIEIARNYGIVERVKIEDMEEQCREQACLFPTDKLGLIAVVAGDGMRQIFEKLNTMIVEGGQTMNPSVSELKLAIEQINTEKVFLFPNNTDIIAAAKQAAELSEKEVFVIPSRTIPEGIAGITAFSQEKGGNENIKRMKSSIMGVKSGEITRAVRDAAPHISKLCAAGIKKGDYMGIYKNSIKASGKEADITLVSLLKEIVDKDDSIISIFHRDKDENIEQLFSSLSKAFPDKVEEMLRANFDIREIITSLISGVIGSHVGPGTWGLAFCPAES